jgi:TolA-binding protein
MEFNQDNLELFEAYLKGSLSEEERVAFEFKLMVDSELNDEFEVFKKIWGGFNDIKAEAIRKNLYKIDQELDAQKAKPAVIKKYRYAIALALIVSICLWTYLELRQQTGFSTSMIPYEPGLPVLMGVDHKLEFDNAMSLFKYEQYDKALSGFSNHLASNKGNDTTLYYLGYCQLKTRQYSEAVNSYMLLNLMTDSKFFLKGQYYLAISHWANGDKSKAITLLNKISTNQQHPFASQAKSSLEYLP